MFAEYLIPKYCRSLNVIDKHKSRMWPSRYKSGYKNIIISLDLAQLTPPSPLPPLRSTQLWGGGYFNHGIFVPVFITFISCLEYSLSDIQSENNVDCPLYKQCHRYFTPPPFTLCCFESLGSKSWA